MKADFTGDDVNVRVALEVHNERGQRSHTLPGDRGHRGAGHTQARGAEKTEDKDGVQDDVGQGAQKLGTHGQVGAAGGLQQPLKGELAEDADGAAQADLGVDGAGGYNLGYVGLELEEGAGEKYPNDAEENEGAQSQKDAGVGGLVRFVLLPVAWLLSQTGNLTLVWLAFPIAELMSLTLSAIFLRKTLRMAERAMTQSAS